MRHSVADDGWIRVAAALQVGEYPAVRRRPSGQLVCLVRDRRQHHAAVDERLHGKVPLAAGNLEDSIRSSGQVIDDSAGRDLVRT